MNYDGRQLPAEQDDEDESGCQLLDSFAIFVQLVLAALAFSTLILKRQRESPQRPLLIWSLDVSKQVIGGGVIHTLNIIASHLFGKSLDDGAPESNPCVWYFLNILIDTTFGVFVIWGVLSAVKLMTGFYRLKGFQSGVYGEPPQWIIWFKQLSVYIMALLTMKMVVLVLFAICPWLEGFGKWVLQWTMGDYKLQVLFVMLVFPLVMNIVQFWVVDTIVKHKTSMPIRLEGDEELTEDMLISDEEYIGVTSDVDDDDALLPPLPSTNPLVTVAVSNGLFDKDVVAPIQHASATRANLHRSDSIQSNISVSEDSLYELRISHSFNKQ